MHLSKTNTIAAALFWILSILPISVFAAGLGQLNVESAIGEPLAADIELLSTTPSEMATLRARVASAAAYAAKGLVRPASHSNIKITTAKNSAGQRVLKLNSQDPIEEPFLAMLIELEWSTGLILKEYTALLDPPGYDRSASIAPIQSPEVEKATRKQASAVAPMKAKPKAVTQSSPKSTAKKTVKKQAAAPQVAVEEHLTKRGDTLSKIALRMKAPGVSLDQMLVALYDANPDAFVGNNMNRLKVGKIIQAPDAKALSQISNSQATREVRAQTASWKKYRRKLANIVAESAPTVDYGSSQSSGGRINTATEDQSTPSSSGPKDVVKLSNGQVSANEADMQAKITALQEEVSAREKGLQEAQERTSALEKQIEDMQKLLTLKSDALAEAQKEPTAEMAEIEAMAAAEKAAEVAEAEAAVAAAAQAAEEASQKAAETEVAAPAEAVETPAAVTEDVAAKAPAATPKPTTPKPAVAQSEPVAEEAPSFLSSMMDTVSGLLGSLNTTLIAGAAGLIALLAGGWFYLRNRRTKMLSDFESGIMTTGGLKANTVFGNTSATSVDTGSTSFLTDFSQSTSGGVIDTNDVDAIAEAEVYIAYGRDAQAEEILKDAISKEPQRYELHLKLLEMYAASKNMSAFETVSGELYTTLGADDPTWSKVAAIGAKLEPDNPLYQMSESAGSATAAAAEPVTTPAATEPDAPVASTEGDLDASDFAEAPLASEEDLNFSLGEEPNQPAADNLGAGVATAAVTGAAAAAAADMMGDASASLDVDESVLNVKETDFDINNLGEEPSVAEPELNEPDFANTLPSLDFPETEANLEAEAAEVKAPSAETSAQLGEEALNMDFGEDPTSGADLTMPDAPEATDLAMPSDLSLDMPDGADNAMTELTASLETPAAESAPESVEFDMGTLEGAVESMESADEPVVDSEPNSLNLSELSLDVTEAEPAVAAAAPAAEPVQAEEAVIDLTPADEGSEEVETKLELVAAYIDMDDSEGAQELLEEVIKEGGGDQRKRAEALLTTLK